MPVALLDAELVYEEPEEEEATTVVPGAPDPEMASWAMSAMNELCAGSEENRAAVAAGGGCSIILDFMAFYHNDLCVLRDEGGLADVFAARVTSRKVKVALDAYEAAAAAAAAAPSPAAAAAPSPAAAAAAPSSAAAAAAPSAAGTSGAVGAAK